MLEVLGLEMRIGSVSSSAGAGDKTADLRPADGEIWIVAEAVGYNDEGDLTSRWTLYDGSTTVQVNEDQNVSNTQRWSCYSRYHDASSAHNPARLPYTVSNGRYLRFTTYGLGAGKKGYIDYVVYVIKGIPTE